MTPVALTLSADEAMLAESVTALLSRSAPVDAFRALRDEGSDRRFCRALWSEMAAMGLPAVAADFGLAGATLVMQAAGRHLAASPLASAVAARAILAGSEGVEREPGSIVAIALAGDAALKFDAAGALSGHVGLVPDLREADHVIVAAQAAGEPVLAILDAAGPGVTTTAAELIDHRDYAALSCENAQAVILASGDAARALIARADDIGALLCAAEQLGIAQECFDRTVAYLKTREQFGVLIGTFQALQHRAARLWIDLQLASAVMMKAARAMDQGRDDASHQVSHAKLRLAECAQRVADEAVQMHGGIGVTDDLDIGLFMKRARVLSALYGDEHFHRERLAKERFRLP